MTTVYLVIASPYDPSVSARVGALPPPCSMLPMAAPPYISYTGGEVAVYLSDLGYLSRATDSPSNQNFPARATTAYSLSAALGSESDPLGAGEVSIGDIPVSTADGAQDGLAGYSWAGREVEVRTGDDADALGDFAQVFRGSVSGVRFDETTINLSLQTRLATLRTNLIRTYYAGTGGIEGGADLAGKPVPLVAGVNRQVPMSLLDWGMQIWRVGEKLSSVTAVRNRGLTVTASGSDYADYATLAVATVAAGQYATCLAYGLVRFGSEVTLPTADVVGDAAAGSTARSIVEWLVTERMPAGVRLASPDLDAAALDALAAARPWTMGLYLPDEITGAEAVGLVMRSVGGWPAATREGLLTVGLHGLPGTPVGTITAADIGDDGIGSAGTVRPAWRVVVGFQPMRRVLSESEMSEALTGDVRATYREPYRTASADRSGVLGSYRDAVEYRVDTDLDSQADASTLAQALLALLSRATRRWTVPVRGTDLTRWLGQTWTLEYDRFGLDAGADYVVVGLDESSDGRNALTLWGPPPNG